MDHAARLRALGSTKQGDTVGRKYMNGTVIRALQRDGAVGLAGRHPFRCGPAISGQKSERHKVPMKPFAGIVLDRLDPDIDMVDPCDLREKHRKPDNIVEE